MLFAGAGLSCAQSYPSRPLRFVTGAPASSAEFVARMLAQGITAALGQPVVVEPRPSGGATVFGEIVARAQPDGYTLLIIGSTLWLGPLFRKAPYHALRDFSPISILADSPNIIVLNPLLPINSVRDLIDFARSKSGTLNYSTSGIGASGHLAAELFKAMAGVEITHIPFKGATASVIGVMGATLLALAIFAILPAASALPATIGASNASHAIRVNRP